jgi:7-cyano-7-deazaguanine synthase in queuosine biosynthesis
MKEKKNILVSFSGGLDSTYLLYKNLLEGHNVSICYTEIENNSSKVIVEKFCVERIIEELRKDFPGHKITIIDRYNVKIDIVLSNNMCFKQILIWLLSLVYSTKTEIDEVHIGITMNDDINPYINDIKKIWKLYKKFYYNNEKFPKIKFPLYKTPKYEIVDNLPERYKKLVTYCEDPIIISQDNNIVEFKNCGNCNACKTYIFRNFRDIGCGQFNPPLKLAGIPSLSKGKKKKNDQQK